MTHILVARSGWVVEMSLLAITIIRRKLHLSSTSSTASTGSPRVTSDALSRMAASELLARETLHIIRVIGCTSSAVHMFHPLLSLFCGQFERRWVMFLCSRSTACLEQAANVRRQRLVICHVQQGTENGTVGIVLLVVF